MSRFCLSQMHYGLFVLIVVLNDNSVLKQFLPLMKPFPSQGVWGSVSGAG